MEGQLPMKPAKKTARNPAPVPKPATPPAPAQEKQAPKRSRSASNPKTFHSSLQIAIRMLAKARAENQHCLERIHALAVAIPQLTRTVEVLQEQVHPMQAVHVEPLQSKLSAGEIHTPPATPEQWATMPQALHGMGSTWPNGKIPTSVVSQAEIAEDDDLPDLE